MRPGDDGSRTTVRKCTAAGPTTSTREEPYQWQVIRDFGIRGVIGKGEDGDCNSRYAGIWPRISARGRWCGAGAGRLREASSQCLYDERIWRAGSDLREMEIADFPAMVTMIDATNSLHKEIYAKSQCIGAPTLKFETFQAERPFTGISSRNVPASYHPNSPASLRSGQWREDLRECNEERP